MTIGQLREKIKDLEDSLEIEILAPIEDQDGDEVDASFDLVAVNSEMDGDTGEDHAVFQCESNS
jgi:hypothetical protein